MSLKFTLGFNTIGNTQDLEFLIEGAYNEAASRYIAHMTFWAASGAGSGRQFTVPVREGRVISSIREVVSNTIKTVSVQGVDFLWGSNVQHAKWANQGRGPGKHPPVEGPNALLRWAFGDKQFAYAVANTIAAKGTLAWRKYSSKWGKGLRWFEAGQQEARSFIPGAIREAFTRRGIPFQLRRQSVVILSQ